MFKKLKIWLFRKPNENDLFGTNIRKTFRRIMQSFCEHIWEFRHDVGEEEHGLNPAKRYCKICNKCQRGYYHKFGDIRITWEDEIET